MVRQLENYFEDILSRFDFRRGRVFLTSDRRVFSEEQNGIM